jgi:hypothetical protein
MLRVWHLPEHRPTMDIDMLGRSSNKESEIVSQIRDILVMDVEPDGLSFKADSIQTERITEDADYEGLRIRFLCFLDNARINMQIDIAFGDVVYPAPEKMDFPVMLNSSIPRLFCYSLESSVAEKLEAMVKLGVLNSRMKDFYDVWALSRRFNFDGAKLAEAIRLTFEHRDTVLPPAIEAFTEPFIAAKRTQWGAFRKRLRQEHIPASFGEVVKAVNRFLTPVVEALSSGSATPRLWIAPGPWV